MIIINMQGINARCPYGPFSRESESILLRETTGSGNRSTADPEEDRRGPEVPEGAPAGAPWAPAAPWAWRTAFEQQNRFKIWSAYVKDPHPPTHTHTHTTHTEKKMSSFFSGVKFQEIGRISANWSKFVSLRLSLYKISTYSVKFR